MSKSLSESRPLTIVEAESPASDGSIPVVLIDAGWGSSGYYSESVLKNAAKAGIFPAGTQMYLDHPGTEESFDRPERSVRDLAAKLSTDGVYNEAAKGIVASAKPFGTYAEMLGDKEFLKAIGLSIRAYGDSTIGEAEGRKGQIVTELTEAISVDFVTRAGRGGRVLVDLMESARPKQVCERAVGHGIAEATAEDTRRALQNALTSQYGGEKQWVWVRDFDENVVWFTYETPEGSGIYEDTYEMDDDSITVGGNPVEVIAQTRYVPVKNSESVAAAIASAVNEMVKCGVDPTEAKQAAEAAVRLSKLPAPAEDSTATDVKETNMATIEDKELQELRESADQRAAAEQRAVQAERKLALRDAQDTGRRIISTEATAAGVEFSDLEVEGLLARVALGDDNSFDEAAFTTSVKDVATKRAEGAGTQGIKGFGSFAETHTETASADAAKRAEAAAASAFGRELKGA